MSTLILMACGCYCSASLPHHALIKRGTRGSGFPPEKSQKYGVTYQYWSRSLENNKPFKPAINVGPSSARQRFADGPMMARF